MSSFLFNIGSRIERGNDIYLVEGYLKEIDSYSLRSPSSGYMINSPKAKVEKEFELIVEADIFSTIEEEHKNNEAEIKELSRQLGELSPDFVYIEHVQSGDKGIPYYGAEGHARLRTHIDRIKEKNKRIEYVLEHRNEIDKTRAEELLQSPEEIAARTPKIQDVKRIVEPTPIPPSYFTNAKEELEAKKPLLKATRDIANISEAFDKILREKFRGVESQGRIEHAPDFNVIQKALKDLEEAPSSQNIQTVQKAITHFKEDLDKKVDSWELANDLIKLTNNLLKREYKVLQADIAALAKEKWSKDHPANKVEKKVQPETPKETPKAYDGKKVNWKKFENTPADKHSPAIRRERSEEAREEDRDLWMKLHPIISSLIALIGNKAADAIIDLVERGLPAHENFESFRTDALVNVKSYLHPDRLPYLQEQLDIKNKELADNPLGVVDSAEQADAILHKRQKIIADITALEKMMRKVTDLDGNLRALHTVWKGSMEKQSNLVKNISDNYRLSLGERELTLETEWLSASIKFSSIAAACKKFTELNTEQDVEAAFDVAALIAMEKESEKEIRYNCNDCKIVITTPEDLKKHLGEGHTVVKMSEPVIRPRGMPDETSIGKEGMVKCLLCDDIIKEGSSEYRTFKGEICNKHTIKDVPISLMKIAAAKSRCKTCDYAYVDDSEADDHKKKGHTIVMEESSFTPSSEIAPEVLKDIERSHLKEVVRRDLEWEKEFPQGLSEHKTPRAVAEAIGEDNYLDGVIIELQEHQSGGDNVYDKDEIFAAAKTAADHIQEDKNYYPKLRRMEEGMQKDAELKAEVDKELKALLQPTHLNGPDGGEKQQIADYLANKIGSRPLTSEAETKKLITQVINVNFPEWTEKNITDTVDITWGVLRNQSNSPAGIPAEVGTEGNPAHGNANMDGTGTFIMPAGQPANQSANVMKEGAYDKPFRQDAQVFFLPHVEEQLRSNAELGDDAYNTAKKVIEEAVHKNNITQQSTEGEFAASIDLLDGPATAIIHNNAKMDTSTAKFGPDAAVVVSLFSEPKDALKKEAKVDIEKALGEVAEKSTEDINRDTAFTWASRAMACYKMMHEAKEEEKKDELSVRAEDFRHEALEHAALVGDASLAKEIHDTMETARAGAPLAKEAELGIIARIVKKPDGFHVYAETGRHMGGPYSSRAKAKERLQQIEMFKHMKGASMDFQVGDTAILNTRVGFLNEGTEVTVTACVDKEVTFVSGDIHGITKMAHLDKASSVKESIEKEAAADLEKYPWDNDGLKNKFELGDRVKIGSVELSGMTAKDKEGTIREKVIVTNSKDTEMFYLVEIDGSGTATLPEEALHKAKKAMPQTWRTASLNEDEFVKKEAVLKPNFDVAQEFIDSYDHVPTVVTTDDIIAWLQDPKQNYQYSKKDLKQIVKYLQSARIEVRVPVEKEAPETIKEEEEATMEAPPAAVEAPAVPEPEGVKKEAVKIKDPKGVVTEITDPNHPMVKENLPVGSKITNTDGTQSEVVASKSCKQCQGEKAIICECMSDANIWLTASCAKCNDGGYIKCSCANESH